MAVTCDFCYPPSTWKIDTQLIVASVLTFSDHHVVITINLISPFVPKVGKTMKTKEADYVLETVHNLAQVIPEIWLGGKDGEDQRIKRTGSELDATLPTTPVGA